ncbi:MAG: ATP-binding protein [wastewater metagenome]|nr:ATP-binding protein [Candidatus Loosdrechtia aerotolerans]
MKGAGKKTSQAGLSGKRTGMGLSICHTLIKDHDGDLIIDSVEGKYTRITITLPARLKTTMETQK